MQEKNQEMIKYFNYEKILYNFNILDSKVFPLY